jgi:outer membrane protein assembly factor BamB
MVFNGLKYIYMNSRYTLFFYFIIGCMLLKSEQAGSQSANWTQFRGSRSNGLAETENIPLKWDDSVIKWKKEIHDKGHSSPVVFGDQIWLTTAKDDGKELYAICLNYKTGEIIYDIKIFTPSEVDEKHQLNTYATPTPCIENGFVYVHYGNPGTACINTADGTIIWKNSDYKCKFVQGPASSPVLYKNMVILHYEGVDVRYLVALDKSNGKLIWKSDRPADPYKPLPDIGKKAYTTPLIINVKGHDLLISNGSAVCIAYDPNTGKEIWRVVDGAESTVAMPISENGLVYWYTGFMAAGDGTNYTDFLAVNPDGQGDITATNISWKKRDGLAQNQMLTPVIRDGLIYTVNTRGIMMCIDAKTGEEVWSKHVTSGFNASPLFINGNIWFFSVKGEVLVLKAGRKYEVVAQNKMDSGIWATPAVLRNSMILRTQNYVCRISEK